MINCSVNSSENDVVMNEFNANQYVISVAFDFHEGTLYTVEFAENVPKIFVSIEEHVIKIYDSHNTYKVLSEQKKDRMFKSLNWLNIHQKYGLDCNDTNIYVNCSKHNFKKSLNNFYSFLKDEVM